MMAIMTGTATADAINTFEASGVRYYGLVPGLAKNMGK